MLSAVFGKVFGTHEACGQSSAGSILLSSIRSRTRDVIFLTAVPYSVGIHVCVRAVNTS